MRRERTNALLENYGHWGFPGEFLNYGGASHQVGGEFWLTDRKQRSYTVECRAASSAAHTYGKNLVSAEAFTASFTFRQTPRDLKLLGDWAWTEGINHYVLHLYIHQPDERKPGMNAWFGTDFNRHSTWFHSTKVILNTFAVPVRYCRADGMWRMLLISSEKILRR